MRKKEKFGKRKYGWHLLGGDMRLRFGDNRKVEVGKSLASLPLSRVPVVCSFGMHASSYAFGALSFYHIIRNVRGAKLCRVAVSSYKKRKLDSDYEYGSSYYDGYTPNAKFAGTYRKCLFMWDISTHPIFKEYAKKLYSKIKQMDLERTNRYYRYYQLSDFYMSYRNIKRTKNTTPLALITLMSYFSLAYGALSPKYIGRGQATIMASEILEDMLLKDMKKQKEKQELC